MSEFKFDPKELEQTKAEVQKSLNTLKQTKADMMCMDENGNVHILDTLNRFQSVFNEMSYLFQSLSRRIDYLSQSFSEHVYNGHLPPAPGPGGMASAIEALGWSEDFEVKPRQIYASLKDGSIKFNGKEIKI